MITMKETVNWVGCNERQMKGLVNPNMKKKSGWQLALYYASLRFQYLRKALLQWCVAKHTMVLCSRIQLTTVFPSLRY